MEPFTKIVLVLMLFCIVSSTLSDNSIQEDYEKLSNSNIYFASKIYKLFANNTSNLVFSPLSISVALSMLSVGANGKTFRELNETLGFQSLNEQELLAGYQSLVTRLTGVRDGYELTLANAQYVERGFPIYQNYSKILVDDFHAQHKEENFTDTVTTLRNINRWVDDTTRGKIPVILEELDPLDVMVLLNAVYFKADWETMFEESQTNDVDFFTLNGTRKQVKMMNRLVPCKFHREHHVLGGPVLELPYKGKEFSMILLMPAMSSNLSSLEDRLTPEVLVQITDTLESQNVTVGIPKIKLESSLKLIPFLRAAGINEVFEHSADLKRISAVELYVSQAVHKAVIELNEAGAEAAAATAIVTTTRTGGYRPYFWASRPFVYMVRHNPTNTICFMGRVVDVE